MGMDEGGYDAPPQRAPQRQAPPAPAAARPAPRPAPNFSDMDDDIPF
jgi:single-strand DNA-binding protein